MHDIKEWGRFTDAFAKTRRADYSFSAPSEASLKNGMTLALRTENEADRHAVEELTRRAFWEYRPGRAAELGGIGCDEHYLCHMLRVLPEFMPELDFVAEYEGEIIGNVMYCAAYVKDKEGALLPALIFGPLSVAPEYQKLGVGAALMRRTIETARSLGFGAIFLYGHPSYYPRLGFYEAAEFGVTTADGRNFPAFMAMELKEGYLKNLGGGAFFYSPAYEVDAAAAREYDKLFAPVESEPRMEKLERRHLPFFNRLMNLPEILESLHTVKTTLDEWERGLVTYFADPDEANYIIYHGIRPAGWLKINGLLNSEKKRAWISGLVILPEYQRRGLGSFALAYAERYMESFGFGEAAIHTTFDNISAQRCYEKSGYSAVEKIPRINGDGGHGFGYTYLKTLGSDTPERIKARWGAYIYERQENYTYDVELLLELLASTGQPQKVLEAACGGGRILVPLAKAGHDASGFDIDTYMLARIKAKAEGLENISWRVLDGLAGDWGSGYDAVVEAGNLMLNINVSGDFTSYERAQKTFIKKAAGSLKDGGHLYLDFDLSAHPERVFNGDGWVIFEGEADDAGVYGRYESCGGRYDPLTRFTAWLGHTIIKLPSGEEHIFPSVGVKHIPTLETAHGWLAECGFEIEAEYGSHDRAPIGETTQRAIIWAKKL